MKKSIFLFLQFAIVLFAFSQTSLEIPYGSPVNIDGIADSAEWDGIPSVEIDAASGVTTVYFKHDSFNLYLMFAGNLESKNKFPEVLIDPENDQSNEWLNDDWWFHVSATDCESNGVHSDYTNCEETQPDWLAFPNFTAPGLADTVELSIPLNKLNVDMNISSLIGIAFETTNTFSTWDYYPEKANIDSPSTWKKAVLKGDTNTVQPNSISILKENELNDKIFPNPMMNTATLTFSLEQASDLNIVIYDMLGQKIKNLASKQFQSGRHIIAWDGKDELGNNKATGNYIYQIILDGKIATSKKFILIN